MADMKKLESDFDEFRLAVSSFLPPPWGLVLNLVPGVIDAVRDLLGDGEDLSQVNWADVDWEQYRIKGDVVEELLSRGVNLSKEEIDEIRGVGL